ncbi:MAG: hypothetical protein ACT4QB_10230 [Gammaproteobacteria bacterium]
MSNKPPYTPKQFALNGLNGISDRTLKMHFKLYEGHVKETNNLREQIARFLANGKVDQEEMPDLPGAYTPVGLEYYGMVLRSAMSLALPQSS